jgi:hypothetical protein
MSDIKYVTLVNNLTHVLAAEHKEARMNGLASRAVVVSDIYDRFSDVVDGISADILPDIAEVDWQTVAIEPEDETLADVVDKLVSTVNVSTVNLDGEIVDGDDDDDDDVCPFVGECGVWRSMFSHAFDFVQQGVEDAESGGFVDELTAYRVILAYMRGLRDASGMDSIG